MWLNFYSCCVLRVSGRKWTDVFFFASFPCLNRWNCWISNLHADVYPVFSLIWGWQNQCIKNMTHDSSWKKRGDNHERSNNSHGGTRSRGEVNVKRGAALCQPVWLWWIDWGWRATLFKLAISTIYRAGKDKGRWGGWNPTEYKERQRKVEQREVQIALKWAVCEDKTALHQMWFLRMLAC